MRRLFISAIAESVAMGCVDELATKQQAIIQHGRAKNTVCSRSGTMPSKCMSLRTKMTCGATLGCQCEMPHLVGTRRTWRPSKSRGIVLDGTDLSSFGVILYEALTGELPWDGNTPMEFANARLVGDTPRKPCTKSGRSP